MQLAYVCMLPAAIIRYFSNKFLYLNCSYPLIINAHLILGTSESRRILQASMKHGHVDAFIDKMLFHGSAGVGKTCTQHIVAGDNPPDIRNSTPLATRPVTIYQLQAMKEVWKKYESQDRMKLCAQISKSVLGRDIIKVLQSKESKDTTPRQRRRKPPKSETDEESRVPVEKAEIISTPQLTEEQATKPPEAPAPSEKSIVDPEVVKVIHDTLDKMYQLIDECPDNVDPITYLHKVRIVDCGGQPQFHEILPIFLRKMSMIVFVIKLSEELSSRPTVEYYDEGKALGESYESDYTTEQLLQQGLRSIHSHRSNKDSEGDSPRIVVVGTHKDLEKGCKETREMKNEKLREMLLPTFSKEVVYSQASTEEVIFPMNAKHPGKEEEDVAAAIRSVISRKRQSNPRQLPLMWLTLEIILEEITKALNRGVLTMDECFEIARRLHFDEGTLEAALIYFDELSLIFYYRDILPGLVFTNPQVVLSKISELVKIHHDKMKGSYDPSLSEAWHDFYHHALVTIKFLSQEVFEKHYVPGIFEPEHIKLLYRKLFIFADYSEEKFFVPSLLRMLDNEVSKKRVALDSAVAPLVLHFPDGPPRRGIFCALMSFLTSPENHYPGPWKVKMLARSLTPTCLYRNCIQFTIPNAKCPCTITLIDTLLQFEVHLKIISKDSPGKICCSIKQAITTGLQKANVILGYTNSTPSFALLCPCGEGGPHHASFGDGYWICSLDEGVGDELSPNQHIWLEDNSATTATIPSGMYNIIL